jgi:RNA polymerase sigma-70 factor (ECF subfamily)
VSQPNVTTAELITRARAGDGEAFRELTQPYRRELQVHCYRMLGSLQEAEDALQDTMLSAWQGLAAFEGRASVRTWLYRIATNRCLNVLRSAHRRPAEEWNMSEFAVPEPTRRSEIVWLEPYPDSLGLGDTTTPGPEARVEQTEAISLAFVTALQVLPPRQRAVLILREVLGYSAREVADMLDASVDSVTSALRHARAAVQERVPEAGSDRRLPIDSATERALVARFVRAFESGDVDALVELLTADVNLSMPPLPLEYEGADVVGRFYAVMFSKGRLYDLVPTRANGQPAFGTYLRNPSGGVRHGAGLVVLTIAGERISAITRFEGAVLGRFGLPRSLPERD